MSTHTINLEMKQVHGDILWESLRYQLVKKMAINVVGSSDPLSLLHEAHISSRSTKVNFHWFLSGCSIGNLEICTHVILMPESHNHPSSPT